MPTRAIPKDIQVRPNVQYIGPQPGPQEDLLSCPSEIIIFGGGAGG